MYKADGGTILYHPAASQKPLPVDSLAGESLRQYREKARYVFQDPARSLNPRMSVYEVLVSGLRSSAPGRRAGKKRLRAMAAAALEEVGFSAADLDRRPSEFSGGQRQRISIARGLLVQPDLLICDEIVSALDVSIQGQILNLLLDIRARRDISFLFIAHDLKVACYFCDRIGVMYQGELMEEAPAADLYRAGRHPYTQLLFSSATQEGEASPPAPKPPAFPLPPSAGDTPATPPSGRDTMTHNKTETAGCAFAGRCPGAQRRCFAEKPPLRETAPGHTVRCFLPDS
jgi:oligopeptide/dipeptide ABC transporter ATP-binding protein